MSLIFALLPLVSRAQTLTNAERRKINSRILSVVEDYERYAELYDEEAEYFFQNIFVNGDKASVFCDLLGMPDYQNDITVAKYMELLREHSTSTTIVIKDVVKGNMIYEDGVWNVPVSFHKALLYIDQSGTVFSTNDYYGADFEMTMYLSYYPDADQCLIRSLTGTLISERKFPKDRFYIVRKPSDEYSRNTRYLATLTVDGEPLEFDQYDQAIFANGVFEVTDPDVEVQTEAELEGHNYDVLSFNFIPRNTRVRFRYGFAPIAYLVNGQRTEIKGKSNAVEFATDFGFVYQVSERSKMSINFGVGLSISNLHLSYSPSSPYEYEYCFLPSPVNGLYNQRKVNYTIKEAWESVRYTDAFVPIYFEVEHMVNKDLMVSWNIGAKVYYTLGAEAVKPYNLNAEATIEEKRENVELFSEAEGTCYIVPNSYAKNDLEFSAMANLGVDVNLYKKRVYAMARVGYEYGMKAYESNTSAYRDYIPVIYDDIKKKHIAVNSLISGVSLNRSSPWISIGVKLKL